MNPYNYLFYIIYKFVKFTTDEKLQKQVPSSALAGLFIGLTNNYAALIIQIDAIHIFTKNIFLSIIIFSVVPIVIYRFNKRLFIANENFKKIENHYDVSNKLKKIHFILITALYLFGSLILMIWVGIYHTKNN
jgi:EamA domain-containing membrane protein RarD